MKIIIKKIPQQYSDNALNSRKWKHEDGGYLNLLKGGGSKNPAAEKAMKYFMSKGLARHQAAGLIGNLMRESGLNPNIVNKSSGAYGIAQWLGDRKDKLFAKYGNKPTLNQQLDYIWEELNSSHKSGLRHLLASKNAEEAARMGMGYYEFSAGPEGAIAAMNRWGQDGEGSMRKGIMNANQLMSLFPPTTSETILTTTPKESVSPDSSIFTVPAFSTSVYIPSEAPQLPTPDLKSIEDRYRETEDRRQAKIQKFNVLNSLMEMAEQNNGYTGLESLLNTRYTNTDPLLNLANEYAEGGEKDEYADTVNLPEVVVTGYKPIELKTYYPLSKRYPWTGHSSMKIPITSDVADAYELGDEDGGYSLMVSKKSNAKDYNLFSNNCADATLGYLNAMFGTDEKPWLFTTPGDVRDYAVSQLDGKVVDRNGVETILIPRTAENADELSRRALNLMGSNNDRKTAYLIRGKAFGGPLVDAAMKHIYDGTTEPTQQMNRKTVYKSKLGRVFKTREEAVADNKRYYRMREQARDRNVLAAPSEEIQKAERGIKGARQHAAFAEEQPFLENTGMALGAAPLAIAAIPAVSAAVEAAPAVASTLAPGSAFWTNPITQQIVSSTLGGEAVNLAAKTFTPYDSWGEGISDVVNRTTGWNPQDTWWGATLADMTNLGYLTPYGLLENGMTSTIKNAGNIFKNVGSIIDNKGFGLVSPSGNRITWIGKGTGSSILLEPTADGWMDVDYITSLSKGTGRKLYDAAIQEAQKRGFNGVRSGESLMSAPKTYSIWEHYPDKVHLGDYGSHGNQNIVLDNSSLTTKVNTVEELIDATDKGIDAAIMRGAPVYGLTAPSQDIFVARYPFYFNKGTPAEAWAEGVPNATTNSSFKSELDWSPESWFEKAAGRGFEDGTPSSYTTEDIKELTSHLKEYNKIEEKAKELGVWLKMPDGSTWAGDPRSWVQLQSKALKGYDKNIFWSGRQHTFNPEYNDVVWGINGQGKTPALQARTYAIEDRGVLPLVSEKTPTAEYNVHGNQWFNLWGENIKTNDLVKRDFSEGIKKVVINNVRDLGPNTVPYNSVFRTGNKMTDYTLLGTPQNDVIVAPNVIRKSLIGNNGAFNKNITNAFRTIAVPTIFGVSANNYYNRVNE